MICKTLRSGVGSGLLVSMLEKLDWFRLTSLMVLLMKKWMGLLLRKNHLLRCWGWFSLLNLIGTLTLSLLPKLPPRKLMPWFVLCSKLVSCICISKISHTIMLGILLPCLGWGFWLLLGIARSAPKTDIQELLHFLHPRLIIKMEPG